MHVSSRQRLRIEKIFLHPAGGNIEWRQALSVFEDLGTVTTEAGRNRADSRNSKPGHP
jgi:hypothetical protein